MKARKTETGTVLFMCPGCNRYHGVNTDPKNPNAVTSAVWGWNGSLESPTFRPSILLHPHETVMKEIPEGLNEQELKEFLDANRVSTPLCHSYVRDGKIEFLSDSTHELSGRTVDLPELTD